MRKFRTAVLLVHGFAGGVYDAEYLDHRLELISKYDVYTFTLPGHDGDTSKKITAASWIKKAESEVEFLINNGYKKIYVIGHSMGGVIATYLASKYKEVQETKTFNFTKFTPGMYSEEKKSKKFNRFDYKSVDFDTATDDVDPIQSDNSPSKYLLNNEDAIFFLSRMIYPSYYFDLCEKIIYENINENELSIILDRANNYEKFLKKIYHILSDTFIIPNIEWLKEIKYL